MTQITFEDSNANSSYGAKLARLNAISSWALLRSSGGTHITSTTVGKVSFGTDTITDFWRDLYRSILIFPTSSIPDGATITSATVRLRGYDKGNPGVLSPNINIFSAAPADPSNLVVGDFDRLGVDFLCDNAISYPGWVLGDWNEFALNATGIAAINKTGLTAIGVMESAYDYGGATPVWFSPVGNTYISFYGSVIGIPGRQPQLIVTYSTGIQATTDIASSITSTGATLNGTLDDEGAGACICSFDYGLTVAYGTNVQAAGTYRTGESFSKAITGLNPGTLYHYRAVAIVS